jgi:parallel beta-helix repeat protein
VLYPGNDIQGAVNANPPNTQFVLQPGVYRLQSVQPKSGDSFAGQPGAILNGAALLTSFGRSGSLWFVTGQMQQGQTNGVCDSGHPGCGYPEDLFFDNKPLLHVTSLSAVTSGTWFFDYPNHTVYLADDPSGHTVELGTARSAFWGPAANVTIQGLIVEKYAIPAQFGAIGDQYPGPNWVISRNEVRWNHGTGITLSNGSQALQNSVHDNGQKGIGGVGANMLVDGNEIYNSNWAGFDLNWEAGATKFALSTGLVIRNNNVHDNDGPGIWADVDCMNTLIENNTVTANYGGPGIQYEISYNATIRNNTVRNNYVPNGGWWEWGAQILIQNSSGVEVYGNTVDVLPDRGNGIGIINQNRGSGTYGLRTSTGNYIHNNTIITRQSPQGSTGLVADYDQSNILATGNNRFDSNNYHVTNVNAFQYAWGWGMTFSQFQQAGQELHGTIDTQLPPESGGMVGIGQAAACTYSINPGSTAVSASGGTGSLNVEAPTGCSWTATSSAGWLSMSPGTGNGNGSITYTAAADNTTASRSATLNIAGQTFTVSQAGLTAPGAPTLVLETPAKGAAVSGMIAVEGYAWPSLAGGASISSVVVAIDGKSMGNAVYGAPRNDACAQNGNGPGCPNVGFGLMLDGNTLTAGSHTVTVTATTSVSGLSSSATASATVTVSPSSAIYYEIANKNSGKALDVADLSTANGAAIHQWDYVGGANQQWQLVAISGGQSYYEIVNRNSGKVLDVIGVSPNNGALLQQWQYSSSANQQWQLVPVDASGNYQVVNRNSGKALDVQWQSTINGALVQQWDYAGGDNQKWQLVPVQVSAPYYEIVNAASGKVLDVDSGSVANGALIHQWDNYNLDSQKWQIIAIDSTYVKIVNKKSGKSLDVQSFSINAGALVQQWDFGDGLNQQWQVISVGGGLSEILNRNSNQALDVQGSSTANGALIQQWSYWGGANQQWKLVPVQ